MNLFNLDNSEDQRFWGSNRPVKFDDFASPIAKPTGNDAVTVDVVNNYKWTKTLKEGRAGVPFLRLREMYVTRSAFLSNLQYAANTFSDSTDTVQQLLTDFDVLPDVVDYINRGQERVDRYVKKAKDALGVQSSNFQATDKHLTPYYNLYGIEQSGFIYKIPYLQDEIIETNSSWGKGGKGAGASLDTLTKTISETIFGAAGIIEDGYAMEFAKSYSVPESGPSINTTLFLDNTKDISDDSSSTSWNKNWQLIYLLTYQSLPNRKTRFINQPPTIYELFLDGVTYFPYSYTSGISVKCHGVRKRKKVSYLLNNEVVEADTLIPEVYELSISWQSLVANTKNLYYESLRNKGVNFKLVD